MAHNPARFEDEGTYVAQAWAIRALGQLAQYTYWYDHPPLGWMVLGLWTNFTGALGRAPSAVAAGREFMLVVQLVNCALLFALARRLGLRRAFAALAVALFAFSPLALTLHRMVLLDNIAVAWILAAFLLAATPRRSLWAYAAAGGCFAAAVLTKETSLLLLPAVLVGIWYSSHRLTRGFCIALFAVTLGVIGSVYILYATLKGELVPGAGHVSLWEGVSFQLFSREGSGSVFDPSSDAHGLVMSWWRQDPWLIGLGTLLTVPALAIGRLRGVALAALIQLLMLLRHGYLPFPYVICFLPFAAVIVAGAFDAAWRWRPWPTRPGSGRAVYGLPGSPALSSARIAVPAGICAVLLAAALALAPAWIAKDGALLSDRPDRPASQAVAWVRGNLDPKRTRVLVDGSMWLDLVRMGFGFSPGAGADRTPVANTVWFYKLDFDPEVQHGLPGGYRAIDYVVSTDVMRASLSVAPETRAAVSGATIVASFGDGTARVDVLRTQSARAPAYPTMSARK